MADGETYYMRVDDMRPAMSVLGGKPDIDANLPDMTPSVLPSTVKPPEPDTTDIIIWGPLQAFADWDKISGEYFAYDTSSVLAPAVKPPDGIW